MPRKKRAAAEAATDQTGTDMNADMTTDAVANTGTDASAIVAEPLNAESPATAAGDAPADGPANPEGKNWSDPYKAVFTSREKRFELGENRRFKQRLFTFADKPGDDVLAALKDAGFTYRAAEKAWTIQASPETRQLSDDLARQFAGPVQGMSR